MSPEPCRSCQAPVLWLRHTRTGKRAPIDAEPAPEGNIVVGEDGTYLVLNAQQAAEVRERGGELHLNHFVTCSQADAWKGSARERQARIDAGLGKGRHRR